MEWISTLEKLPEFGVDILLCGIWNGNGKDTKIKTGRLKSRKESVGGITLEWSEDGKFKVTHWMPLPSPPNN